ncbi:MAG: glycosyltransferase family 4 protein [Bacteroidota bacterium]
MKITIVCGHFIPAMGYIEVHLARSFTEIGHEVSVVTSDSIPSYVQHLHSSFGEPLKGVNVIRLKPFFTLGQIVLANGVKEAVSSTNPDRVIVIGLGKRFPKPTFSLNYKTTVLFGDNAASYGSSPSLKTKLLFNLFKRKTYQTAVENADRLVAYTPESFEAAAKMLGGKSVEKLHKQDDFISLGFNPSEYYFDQKLRQSKRQDLGYKEEDQVVITATRIRPEKNLESAISAFKNSPQHVKWLLLGSAEDYYANQLVEKLKSTLGKGRFKMFPHQKRGDLNAFYNAADAALFTTPAISIIEAMGAGLPVFIPRMKSLSHLISSPSQGAYYDDPSTIALQLKLFENRESLASLNRHKLSWKRQAEILLQMS